MLLWGFMQKQKGAISIFMAVIMFSMFVLTSVFVDGSRIRSAETIVQSASDSAIRSVLAKYDKDLKDRYGLFTLEEENSESIKQDYFNFLEANLSASVPGGTDDSFHKYFNKIVQSVSGETEKDILDLFDFQVSKRDSKVDAVYSIVEPNVLQKQMVEFAKYRSALVVADMFDIGSTIKESVTKSKIDTKNLQITLSYRKDVESVMTDVYDWAEKLKQKEQKWNTKSPTWKNDVLFIKIRAGELEETMQEIADIYNQIEIEQQKEEADTTELEQNLQDLQKEAKEIYSPSNVSLKYYNDKKIVPLIKELETMKLELVSEQQKIQSFLNRITQSKSSTDNAKNSLNNNGTENVTKNLQYDIEQTKSELSKLENIVEENQKWIDNRINKIDDAIKKLEGFTNKIKPSLSEATSERNAKTNIVELKKIKQDIETAAKCFQNSTGESVKQYQFQVSDSDSAKKLNDFYNALKGSKIKESNKIENPAIISGGQKEKLPSTLYKKDNTYHTNEKYKELDAQYIQLQQSSGISTESSNIDLENIDTENVAQSINVVNSFLNILDSMATNATNSVITDLYTMGMFKARTTKTTDYWKEVYQKSMVNIEGESFDRKRNVEVDKNLRFQEKAYYSKANGNNFMDAELEYIIIGNANEANNASSVYTRIFAIRMGINTIAVLSDKELNNLSTAAASIAGPFAPLAKVAILLILALVETYLDMYFLIDKGYKVALLKNGNLTLSSENLLDTLSNLNFDNIDKGVEVFSAFQPNTSNHAIMLDYETYLYFLLLLVNRETKLLRMADIMQLNIQKQTNNEGYIMADHYTGLRVEIEATIKTLMMGLPFVPSDMKKDGKYKITTMLYGCY